MRDVGQTSDLSEKSRGDARPEACIYFGPFQFFPARPLLQRDGVTLRLGSRALEVLTATTPLVLAPFAFAWQTILPVAGSTTTRSAFARRFFETSFW